MKSYFKREPLCYTCAAERKLLNHAIMRKIGEKWLTVTEWEHLQSDQTWKFRAKSSLAIRAYELEFVDFHHNSRILTMEILTLRKLLLDDAEADSE